MASGRLVRLGLKAMELAAARIVAVAIVATALSLSAQPARSQPPAFDPFAQPARQGENVAENGQAWPPPYMGPVAAPGSPVAAPSGPITMPGNYQPGPPPGQFVPSPPPSATPSGQFPDAMQVPSPVPAVGPEPPSSGTVLPDGQPLPPIGSNSVYRFLDHLEVTGLARGYYSNDQRVVWSGMEENFGAEGIIAPRLRQKFGDLEFVIDSEFYINEPYDGNQLALDPERKSYAANFQVDPFEISQLALVTNYNDWTFKIGKFVTPFGRFYTPLYSNSRMDAPFIRTDVIDWRETGILAHYKSGLFVGDIALTDDAYQNLGTNSSKSLVGRIGLDSDFWAIGGSVKKGGGTGSEQEKEFNNYYGVDAMVRSGPFRLSGECIYNQYGFGRPGFDPLDTTWVKSIYYRDVSSGQQGVLCTGWGYYVNLDYADGPWSATLDYGDFRPLSTGTAPDQRVLHRGLVKAGYRFAESLQVFSVLIVENGGYLAQENKPRNGLAVLEGFQYSF